MLGKILAVANMLKQLPTGRGWFSTAELNSGVTRQLINAFAAAIGDWTDTLRSKKKEFYLQLATEEGLEYWGRDLNVPRDLNEDTETYRQRLIRTINRDKLSKSAIEAAIFEITGLNSEVRLPWRSLDIKSNNYGSLDVPNLFAGKSGVVRRPNYFWQAGVVDVQVWGYDPRVETIVRDLTAAHVAYYITYNDIVDVVDESQLPGETSLVYVKHNNGFKEFIVSDLSDELEVSSSDNNTSQVVLAYSHLFDDGVAPNSSVWHTSQTYQSIANLTWTDAIYPGYDNQSSQHKTYQVVGGLLDPYEFWAEAGQNWNDVYVWKNNQPAQLIEVTYWYDEQPVLDTQDFLWSY